MPNYKNAPITEAVIDIRVESPSGLRFEVLESIKPKLPDYPHEAKQTVNTVRIN